MGTRRSPVLPAAVLLMGLGTGAAAAGPLEVGARVPDLRLPYLEDGRPGSLRDFGGGKLVLHVFASW